MDPTTVLSGIPQESILGPIVFTIFINDLPEVTKSTCKIFADDTQLYESAANSAKIQEDLYLLQEWCDTWSLYLNLSECEVLYIGKDNPWNDYKMKVGTDLVNVQTCTEEKDWGITFDNLLKFDVHIWFHSSTD